jgi:L-aspartate oxidase
MTGLCGISRNAERLVAAQKVLASIRKSIHDFYWNYRVSKDFLEVRNIADVASIVIESALTRQESRACHFREDFPHIDPGYRRLTIVQRGKPVRMQKVEIKSKEEST